MALSFFGISFFVLEIFTFLYYANEEGDDVIGSSTKTVVNQEYLYVSLQPG